MAPPQLLSLSQSRSLPLSLPLSVLRLAVVCVLFGVLPRVASAATAVTLQSNNYVTAPTFSTTNTNSARQNTVDLTFTMCAGETLYANLLGATGLTSACTGDTMIRLYYPNATQAAVSDDVGLSVCSFINYKSALPSCGTFTLAQGCSGAGSCGGQAALELLSVTPDVTLQANAYVAGSQFTAASTNIAQRYTVDLTFTLCPGETITATLGGVSGLSSVCTGNTYLRLYNPSNSQVAFNDDDGASSCSLLTYASTLGSCGTFRLAQGCASSGTCGGQPALLLTPSSSSAPTLVPTVAPTTAPTAAPTAAPTVGPTQPTVVPSIPPTVAPTTQPTAAPTVQPTVAPTTVPTVAPTIQPTVAPTIQPTVAPTTQPTVTPTTAPTVAPTTAPTMAPTIQPTVAPTTQPTVTPTTAPTVAPTTAPTVAPTTQPTVTPTGWPSSAPSSRPSQRPSSAPSVMPSAQPFALPSAQPSALPSAQPSARLRSGESLSRAQISGLVVGSIVGSLMCVAVVYAFFYYAAVGAAAARNSGH